MIRVHNIRGTNGKNKGDETIEWTRSSGDFERRYAIAWVEYIDLSRPPRPPRSRRRRLAPSSPWISPRSTRAPEVCLRLWKIPRFPPARGCTSTPIHLYRRPVRATFVRSIIVPGIDDVALLCPDSVHWSTRDIPAFGRLRPVDDIMPHGEPRHRPEFLPASHRKTSGNATLTYYKRDDSKLLIAPPTSRSYNTFQHVATECMFEKFLYKLFPLYIIAICFLINQHRKLMQFNLLVNIYRRTPPSW